MIRSDTQDSWDAVLAQKTVYVTEILMAGETPNRIEVFSTPELARDHIEGYAYRQPVWRDPLDMSAGFTLAEHVWASTEDGVHYLGPIYSSAGNGCVKFTGYYEIVGSVREKRVDSAA